MPHDILIYENHNFHSKWECPLRLRDLGYGRTTITIAPHLQRLSNKKHMFGSLILLNSEYYQYISRHQIFLLTRCSQVLILDLMRVLRCDILRNDLKLHLPTSWFQWMDFTGKLNANSFVVAIILYTFVLH